MSEDAAQEQHVTVTGIVTRLVPCARHALDPPGVQLTTRNANGYDHECEVCFWTPRITEELEGVE